MGSQDIHKANRRRFLKRVGIAGSSVFVAGCTGNQNPGSDRNGSSGSSSRNSDPPGTDYSYGTTQTPSTIDPHKASDELESIISHILYDPLLYYTKDNPPELEPGLAKDHQISDDNTTYTFHLRDDATFHNGDNVTADDVVYSLKRLLTMKEGFSYMFENVIKPTGASKVDTHTVKMNLEQKFAPFLSVMPYLFVVNKKQVEENIKDSGNYGKKGDYGTQWLEDNVAGSGAYKLEKRNRKTTIHTSKNEDWWGFPNGNTYEKATIDMVPETSTLTGKMRDGEVDVSDQYLPLSSYASLDQRDNVRVSTNATYYPLYLFMNTQRVPFDDINVRKAMAHLVDYEKVLNKILKGESIQMQGPLPKAMWGHNDNLKTYQKNIDKAKKLLNKSEYSGDDLDFSFVYTKGIRIRKQIGLMLQSNLKDFNIDVSVQPRPWSKIVSQNTKKETTPQMQPIGLSFSYSDPDNFLYTSWHSSSHGSWQAASWYTNDHVDKLLEKARNKTQKKDRIPLYKEVQKIINKDVPAVFTVNKAQRYAINKRVQGFKDNGVTGFVRLPQRFTENDQ